MKRSMIALNATLLAVVSLACAVTAHADSITGSWSGTTLGIYENHFAFVQRGNTVTGSAWSGRPGVITGTINGNTFTLHSLYSDGYSADAEATISGNTMTGTFLDSQGTSGGWIAQRDEPIVSRSTVLYVPPVVEVRGRRATVTAVRFTEVGGETGAKVRYDVKLSGRASSSISSTKNKITFANLGPGKYKASYRVTATRKGKKIFSATKSPTAIFVVK